ncbi:hypothetical protein [Kribbella sp.]|uniref:hypothetical protein n=1 Tax=Kribbella sp. TaxID=1871183 RepID=UPI002D5655B7|nr:hypothetical protein [Kribbella sp.]HZX01542.1 hypothetical protein [Kribbella sp.]
MPERGELTQESGDDGYTRNDRDADSETYRIALGGTQSDPNGKKDPGGWRAGGIAALGTGSQGQGEKEHTGTRISDVLDGKKDNRER